MSGPSKELLIRRERVKDARIAELEATIERLKVCGSCIHCGQAFEDSLGCWEWDNPTPAVYEYDHCHLTPSRWCERSTK